VDITERKIDEEALRQSEDKFSKAFFLSPDAIAITRLVDGVYVAVNEGFKATLGYTEEEVIGKTSLELNVWVNPEDRNRVIDGLKSEGKVDNFEARFRNKTGDIRYGLISVSIIELHGVSHILNIARDITDRRRQEEKLRISEDKFSKAFHMNPDAILITRLVDGMIVMVNEGFMQIFGSTEEEVIGKTALELNIWVNPEDRNRVIEGVKADGKVNNFEFGFRNKAGDVRSGLMSASIITLDGVGHVLSITRDITERRLAQEQLFQAQKMEAIGTLAGGFAHDFNNKLQVIDGYADLILFNKDLPTTVKSELGVIKQTVHSSAELIKGMMVFARKAAIDLQPIELNKLIAQTRSMLIRCMPKMIEIELLLADDLWTVNAAPNQIDQILMNLAINASDAMPDGGKITIKTKNIVLDEEFCRRNPKTKFGKYALITVSDTGTGMNQDTASHIFEPFFTTKEPGKGTGLGLSVVYGIVEKHGGKIICDSKPSVGTTFRIYFPAIGELPQEQYFEKKEPPKGQGETMLLVDDEPLLRDIVVRQLVGANYRVIKASNGNEALNLYKEHREQISLVILDLLMPRMSGKQCLEALRKLDPKVRVLIASGALNSEIEGDLKEIGARGLIAKPFDTPQLLEKIREIIDED
jgi:PAS domain S-box-containing protein